MVKMRLVAGAALGVIASSLAMPALAQEEASGSLEAPSQDSIIVTGSRVARSGFESPTPLTILSQQEIQNQSPSNNIADFVNQLPALAGSTRPANSRLNLSSGQAGINALNLRNLGEIRTLVLVDGRRSVGSTITGLVDVNTIPQSLVKSVEVVTGGASAAYGSDAVAGVVNFTLDKTFEGLRLNVDSGITDEGDGGNYSANIAGGWSFGGGRGHLLVSGEYAHRDGIFEVDRDWNATGYVRIQDPAWTANSTTPQFLIRKNVGAANSTPGGIVTGNTVAAGSGLSANNLRGLYFGQGGSVSRFQYGQLTYPSPTGGSAPSLTQGGDWQVNDTGRRIGLDPEDDRYGLFARLSYEVVDGVTVFAEAAYNKQNITFNAGPNLATGIVLQRDNAFLMQTLTPAQLAGVNTVTVATSAADLPNRLVDNSREVQRYLLGAEGSFGAFGKDAHWDIYAQYGRTEMREQLRNIMNTQRMLNATDAVYAAAGNPGGYAVGSIQCRINVDASTTNNDPSCVPLNRLGLGVANPAALPYVLGDPYRDETAEQFVAGANLSVTPFATWAGDVSVAVGGEYREEKIAGYVPSEYQPIVGPGSTTNLWSVGNYLPTNGSYHVKEAYLETVVPLGLGLEFNGAVRATDYSTSGYVTTWKAGATWQPIPDIRFRVTRSRDIRAPNLNELYQAGSSNSDSVRNPFAPGSGPNGVDYPSAISYSATVVGNTDLRPEKSDQWNIGAVLTPSFLPGFNFSADYFRIEMSDAIGNLSAQEIINRCFEGRQEYCAAITQDPNNAQRILFRSQPFNFTSQLVRGIDFDATYRIPLEWLFERAPGAFTLRGVATRYIDNTIDQGIVGTVPVNTVGSNGGQYSTPKWIYRFSVGYDDSRFSATAVARGVSSGKYSASGIECTTGCPLSTTQAPTYDVNHVSGTFYVDLNLAQRITLNGSTEAQFFINVNNLFDASPLLLPETGLAANSTYSDLLGRQYRVGIRFKM
jgi:Outer membrane cobalamin receptor protein